MILRSTEVERLGESSSAKAALGAIPTYVSALSDASASGSSARGSAADAMMLRAVMASGSPVNGIFRPIGPAPPLCGSGSDLGATSENWARR